MNKFDRVFTTLILMQTKKRMKASMIAERFDISLRTVYRDIATLKNAGIPIIGDPGIGYTIMDGYKLPPMMFNEEEAAALLTAEKFMGQLTDKETQAYYSSAMVKIRAILRSTEKQTLEVLEDAISIANTAPIHKSYLQDLFTSLKNKQLVIIHYQKADGSASQRKIELIGCYSSYNNWYIVAFCLLKQDYRTFKMNRIVDLQILEEYFDKNHISLQDYLDEKEASWKADERLQHITVAFEEQFVEHAERRKYYFGFIDQKIKGDKIEMTFLNDSIEIVARWLLQFGSKASVIAPLVLRERLQELSKELYEHYQ